MSKSSPSAKTLSHLGLAIKICVCLLAAGLVKTHSDQLQLMPAQIVDASHNLWILVASWVDVLASGFYLCALWASSDVFARMAKGDAFGAAMVKGLQRVGTNLIYGAVAAIFIAPTVIFLIGNNFRQMTGVKYHLEIESLTIGLIGLVLVLLAKRGEALKSELAHFV